MPHALAAPDPVTPEWLTEALRDANILPSGSVIGCETRANAAFNSAASHLTLTYSAAAPSEERADVVPSMRRRWRRDHTMRPGR